MSRDLIGPTTGSISSILQSQYFNLFYILLVPASDNNVGSKGKM